MKAPIPLVGGCACGDVRYEVTRQPYMVTVCHCTRCQARTGSAYAMNMQTPRDGFRLTSGATIERALATGSGKLNVHHFCEACLVRTHSVPDQFPEVVYVRPGTLDERSWLRPVVQIWTQEAHPWALVQGVRCIEENPTDPRELVLAWRAL